MLSTVGLFWMGMLAMSSDGADNFGINSGLVGGALVAAATGYASVWVDPGIKKRGDSRRPDLLTHIE